MAKNINAGRIELRRQLNASDVTSLVVGSIIGADIYIAAAMGAKLVGPLSLVIWLAAGAMAIIIALSFAYSATILPKVGGPYAYVKDVAGEPYGFIVGWALLLAEWFSLVVFPVAFSTYLLSFFPHLGQHAHIFFKFIFITIILVTNIFGIKSAGKFNDLLTIGKLSPLVLLIIAGIVFITLRPASAFSNFQPFFRGNINNIGQALVLIFWAYAGFELSTLPADEIREPAKTIPRAIVMGMLIVIIFYVITNLVIVSVVDEGSLAASSAPLITTAARVFRNPPFLLQLGIAIVGIGALISIVGADESGTIGTSRLAYAMSIDGLLPHQLSKLHRSFNTPYVSLILICATALVASVVGTLRSLINSSVFLLSFTYFATCATTLFLERKYEQRARTLRGKTFIPVAGVVLSVLLMTQVDITQIILSLALIAIGIPVYFIFSPKRELKKLKDEFLSHHAILERTYEQGGRFLAFPYRRLKWMIYRLKKIERAWGHGAGLR